MRHRHRQSRWLWFVVAFGLIATSPGPASPLFAQEESGTTPVLTDVDPAPADTPSPAPGTTSPASPQPLPLEVLPHLFQLRDKDGKLQAVPGIGFEAFIEAWKHHQHLTDAAAQPTYSLESFDVTGTATGTSAELIVVCKVQVHKDGWVGVPLQLHTAVLRETPEYDGPGEVVINVDPKAEGHVAWIRGKADQKHSLTLKLVARVEQIGPQSQLELRVPNAAVRRLQLQVPLVSAVASVSEGSTLDAVRSIAGGKTEIRVIGMTGDFVLTWHPADTRVAGLPTILEASSEQLVRINGRSASTEARLRVHSLGSEFDHFRVRLPPGADYVGTPENGVTLVAVDNSAPSGKLYDVRLDKKTTGPVDVRLVTERAHDASQDSSMLELAGFEVVGAVRQWGTVGVQVEGNWQVVWGDSNHVRSVDDVGPAARRDELVAGFEYFVQPYSLTARVVPQRPRTRVEPQYVLLVGSDEVRLQARLKYTIRGAKVRSLVVNLPGWEVDAVGPASLVNVDGAIAGVDESLTIPLLQATSGEVELTLDARRRLAIDADQVNLELPRPQGDVLAADVAVVSDDPVELLPALDKIAGLTPQTSRPPMKLPEKQQEPLYYRTSGESSRFVAEHRIHAQAISASLLTRIEIHDKESRVNETLAYQVAYQPTEHFTLIVPPGISPQRIAIVHEGTRLTAVPTRERSASDNAATPVRVSLPAPVIGRCELQVSYSRPHAKPPAQASSLLAIPLVVPAEGELLDNQLQVVPQPGISVSYPQGPWSAEGRSGSDSSELELSATRAIADVTLAVSSKQNTAQATASVERALLQSYLTHNSRQDRALFYLATNQSRIELQLPDGADTRSVAVLVDGVLVEPEKRQRTLTVSVAGGNQHLIEVRYSMLARMPQGNLHIEGPQIPSARWIQQLYWQVMLPAGEHALLSPPGYSEESTSSWFDLFWPRETSVSQLELEHWVAGDSGVATATLGQDDKREGPVVASTANRYLFSTVGPAAPLELYTMSRSRLVLLASLPLLVVGLLLIYFPVTRHPALLLVVAVAIGAASVLAPKSTLLLGQASVLGLALAAMAVLLARMVPRSAPAEVVPAHGSSFAIRERSVTELYHRPTSGSHPPSTATSPLVPSSPDVE